jgi:hypothetical protein
LPLRSPTLALDSIVLVALFGSVDALAGLGLRGTQPRRGAGEGDGACRLARPRASWRELCEGHCC